MTSLDNDACAAAMARMSSIVDAMIRKEFSEAMQRPAGRMYGMMSYFMGYADSDLKPVTEKAGKRFRSALCLLIAEAYGKRDEALDAALAVELFHNATLIHDDVEDRDEMRRGRPTVWKVWGVNDAINAGDIQCLLAARHAAALGEAGDVLIDTFIEVWEGQYLDFQLGHASITPDAFNEESYLLMTEKKAGALVRVAAEAAGIVAGQSAQERSLLRAYGESLGIGFQIADDYASIWHSVVETKKDARSDIREHKRTLPLIRARALADEKTRDRLDALYALPRQLTESEVEEAYAILNTEAVREYVSARAREYGERAKNAAQKLAISENDRALLSGIVETLVVC